MTLAPWPAFEQALQHSTELEQLLADPAIIADHAHYTQTAKEHGSLAKMVKPYLDYQKVAGDMAQAEAMALAAGNEPRHAQSRGRGVDGAAAAFRCFAQRAGRLAAGGSGRGLRQHHHGNPRRHGRR